MGIRIYNQSNKLIITHILNVGSYNITRFKEEITNDRVRRKDSAGKH